MTCAEATIIGGGIAGLACATALSQMGIQATVLEQAGQITEVGAGLQITPNGVRVLDALGLGDGIRDISVASSAVVLRDYRQGAQVIRLDLGHHRRDQSYLLVHRADLVDLLADGAQRAGVEIRLGQVVSEASEDLSGVRITLGDGTVLHTKMAIGADGLHSRVRTMLNGDAAPFFTGQVAWRALVPSLDRDQRDVSVYMGPGRHLVVYPLRDGRMMNIVAVEERDQWTAEGWNHAGDPTELRRAFSEFGGPVQKLLSQVDQVNVWGLFRHGVADRWQGTHSAILGDAAHPTLPFLAQGANMALEDAWVLSDCLGSMDVAQALPSYQTRRRARVVKVIAAANANAQNYHLRNPLVRFGAHSALRAIGVIAPGKMLGRFDWVHGYDVTGR